MFYNKKSGFSLIELLAILTILCIFASFMIPYFNKIFAKHEANDVLKSISSSIKMAKTESTLRHTSVVLCSSSNGKNCTKNNWGNTIVLFIDINKNRQIDTEDLIIHTEHLHLKYGNLTWKGALNSPSIVFNQTFGLPIGYNGSFYYCNNTAQINQKIILSKMGHIRIENEQLC